MKKKIVPDPPVDRSPRYTVPAHITREDAIFSASRLMESFTHASNRYLNAETEEHAKAALNDMTISSDLLAAVLIHLHTLEGSQ
ncbi:hypothetical protein ACLUS7_15990 [Enterobacterales bacterium BD_CKDN230030183-1A_HGKHYDSX7]